METQNTAVWTLTLLSQPNSSGQLIEWAPSPPATTPMTAGDALDITFTPSPTQSSPLCLSIVGAPKSKEIDPPFPVPFDSGPTSGTGGTFNWQFLNLASTDGAPWNFVIAVTNPDGTQIFRPDDPQMIVEGG